MHRFLLHNDNILDAHEKSLSAGQVGLLNGWGVFSTLRVADGVLFAFERHWERMQRDAAKVHVPFPTDPAELKSQLLRLVEANSAWNATLRVMVVRNRGGMFEGPDLERDFDVLGVHQRLKSLGEQRAAWHETPRALRANEFSGCKILSWSQNLTWYEEAQQRGFDEVVLLNERGEVSECTSANIFAATGGEVYTPPLDSGCLPGVTRELLLDVVRAPGNQSDGAGAQPARSGARRSGLHHLHHARFVAGGFYRRFETSETRAMWPIVGEGFGKIPAGLCEA